MSKVAVGTLFATLSGVVELEVREEKSARDSFDKSLKLTLHGSSIIWRTLSL